MYRLLFLAFCLPILIPLRVHASLTTLGDGAWFTVSHPRITSFAVDAAGNAEGFVEGEIPFRQYTLSNEHGLRIQRFEILDHFHFIVNGEVVYSFTELSQVLAKEQDETPV